MQLAFTNRYRVAKALVVCSFEIRHIQNGSGSLCFMTGVLCDGVTLFWDLILHSLHLLNM